MTDNEKKALKKLQDLLTKTPLEQDEQFSLAFCISASNKTLMEKNCNKMNEFLEKKPNASYDEIQDQANLILGIDITED